MTPEINQLLSALKRQQDALERIAKAAEQTNSLLRVMLTPQQQQAHSDQEAHAAAKRLQRPPHA